MDGEQFDNILRRFCSTRITRVDTLRGLVAGAAAALTGSALVSDDADARKGGKGKGRGHKDKNHERNDKGKAQAEKKKGKGKKGKGKKGQGKKGEGKSQGGGQSGQDRHALVDASDPFGAAERSPQTRAKGRPRHHACEREGLDQDRYHT